jgi:hypothetical protein
MRRAMLLARCIALISVAFAQSVYAELSEKYTLETGMEYFSGSYGSTVHTDILYVPLTGKIQGRDWSAKMTVPYLEITGTGGVVSGIGQTVVPTNTRRVRNGWGDVNMSASRNVYNDISSGFMVNLAGKVKLATASAAKGLSTGKHDYAVEATLFQRPEILSPFATIGYKKYGSPAAYKLNNVFYGSFGASYKLSQESNVGAMYIAGQKVMDNRPVRSELLLFGSHIFDRNWKIQGYLLKGFTTSVPDWGGGVLIDYIFENRKPPQGVVLLGYSDA